MLCPLLFTSRRLEVRQGPILKSRPWRDGPRAIAVLKLARGVAVSTGGAHAPEELKGEGN